MTAGQRRMLQSAVVQLTVRHCIGNLYLDGGYIELMVDTLDL